MSEIQKRQGAYLPHWTKDGGAYFVTFRTADSLPREAVTRLKGELQTLKNKSQWQSLSLDDAERATRLNSEEYENLLDASHGACVLRRSDCAGIVAEALRYHAEKQYRLWAWCIMPNHVHAVVHPLEGEALPKIIQAWKSVSSRRIGKVLGHGGAFWQAEYYDHLIRNEAEFRRFVKYTLENPANAGLVGWKWVGAYES